MKLVGVRSRILIMVSLVFLTAGCVSNSPRSESESTQAPSKTEAGKTTVKGINGWEGEIVGNPAPNSKFRSLQIGMSMKQATDIAGVPTDQGAYVTGKAFIPFYFGSDRHRYEMVFKGQGRLVFAGGSLGNFSGGNLVMIIHNDKEGGYR